MDGCISPAFVKESARPIQVLKVVFICFAAPESHIRNLKITPEMASRVSIGFRIVLRPSLAVQDPVIGIVGMQVLRMCCQESLGFGPQGRNALRGVVKVDGETIGLVVILHVAENVVINVAEEMDLWLHTPVILHMLKGGMLVEHARIPTTHLVI